MDRVKIDFNLVEEHITTLNSIQQEYKKSDISPEEPSKLKLLAQFYIQSGQVNFLLHFYQDALSDLKKAGKLLQKIDEPEAMMELNFLLGKTHLEFNNFDHADLHLKKALRIAQKIEHKDKELHILDALGTLFANQKHPERAFRYFIQRKSLLESEAENDPIQLAFTFLNIGQSIKSIDLLHALSNLFQALSIFEKEEFNSGIEKTLLAIGSLFKSYKFYEEAHHYFQDASQRSNNEKYLEVAYKNMALIAEQNKSPQEALKYLKQHNIYAKRLDTQERLRDHKAIKKQYEIKKIFDDGKFTQAEQKKEVELVAKIQKKNKLIERLTMVAEQTDNVVVITDPEGNFEWANDQFEIRSGLTMPEFMKTRGKNIKDASYNDDIANILNQCIDSRLPVNYNSFYRLENGDIRYQSSKICPIYDEDNTLKNFVVIDSDITEIRRVQNMIQQKNKDITDSINYAKRIQEAILPSRDNIKSDLGDAFVLFKPRDIVSGDFYWMTRVREHILFAVCDCTGHGVPGAFMSMIGNDYLTQIVVDGKVSSPGQTLGLLDQKIVTALKQTGEPGEAKDGMDAALCAINFETMELEFSGAKRPLIIIRDNELIEIKGSKYSIGGNQIKNKFFDSHNLSVQKGDLIYIFSDGYHDQFGGVNGKKFSIKRMKKLLLAMHHLPIPEQKQVLENTLDSWKGEIDQIDDICVIGLKV